MDNIKKILLILVSIMMIGIVTLFGIDLYVRLSTNSKILEGADVNGEWNAIIVLGAGINDDKPSPMLKERLDKAIELYKVGVSDKLIMSGDHGRVSHDEVNVMKDYATKEGVPSEDIFMDHAGFSTYDTMYRAKNIFGVKKAIVVTQKYHLYRSIYIGGALDIDTIGVDATKERFSGQLMRDFREILARVKDFFKCIMKPEAKILGDEIPLTEDGNTTNDRKYITIWESTDDKEYMYISSPETIERIENMIASDKFVVTMCPKSMDYMIIYSTGEIYCLEISGGEVHIIYGEREKVLSEEDSRVLLDILYEEERP